MFISNSAVGAERYYWMRYASAKAVSVTDVDGTKHRIEPKSLFGVREVRGKDYDMVLLTNGESFKLSIAKSEKLMNASKEFRGATPAIKKPEKKQVVTKPVKEKKMLPKTNKAKPVTSLGPKVKPVPIKSKVAPKVSVDKRKPVVAKLEQDEDSPVKVKLSKVHFPELEDFTDTSIPAEFQRYQRVESTGVLVEKLTVSFDENAKH